MTELTRGTHLPLERYRALMEDSPIPTVDVLIFNADKSKVLLGRRTNPPYAGELYTFGGRLYKNEELIDAAIRIAKSELGLAILPADLLLAGVINELNPDSIFDGINYHALNVYFACQRTDVLAELDAQHSSAEWVDVQRSDLLPYVQEKIQGALRTLNVHNL